MEVDRAFEKRTYARTDATLVVSYRVRERPTGYDISQSKNVSYGGMLLTTNCALKRGTHLALTVRLPLVPEAVEFIGEVIDSKEVVKDLIYDTRLKFLDREPGARESLGYFVQQHIKERAQE